MPQRQASSICCICYAVHQGMAAAAAVATEAGHPHPVAVLHRRAAVRLARLLRTADHHRMAEPGNAASHVQVCWHVCNNACESR